MLVVACALAVGAPGSAAAADPVLFAAGDIACDPADSSFNGGLGTPTRCRQKYTADRIAAGGAGAVLALGDLQYNAGSLSNFQRSYALSWGVAPIKSITHPVIGNHESTSATGGAGYCTYFGAAAHCNSSGRQGGAAFYSFDLGSWHVVVINSNCTAAGGCGVGSAQYQWLAADLAANPRACTLAAWHHPRWSSGHDGSNSFMQPIWKLLYDNGGDLVLAGHSHNYERFAPITGTGAVSANGMRSFVVGTGGAFFTGIGGNAAGSERKQNNTFGVLRLALHPTSYEWAFVAESGKTFSDFGSQNCRGGGTPSDTTPPTAPGGLSAAAASSTRVDLSWTAASDAVGVTGYEIRRGVNGGAPVPLTTVSGSTLSHADTSVAPATTYAYEVVARDAAGNVSPPSDRVTVTTPPSGGGGGGGTTLGPFRAVADASVKQAEPGTNFGSSSSLNSDSGTGVAMESALRFDVTGVAGRAVTSAKLRLFVNSDGTVDGPGIHACTAGAACTTWSESTITWTTRLARAASPVADIGTISPPVWNEYDVTPLVTGDGPVTLIIGPTPTTDGTIFRSDEASSGKPELHVTVG
jgi:hypothetical protein